jgi:hypothetical protein
MGWFGPSKAEKAAAAAAAAAEKGSDRHLWQAARDGKEAELGRLIGLGWSVNWHNPDEVRRRMCLAWAPSAGTARAPRRWRAATPPPRRAWHTRPRRMARAAPPRARPRSSRALALDDAACAPFATVRRHSFDRGHIPRARRVRPPPPRGRGDRGQRQGKPRACPPPAHAMGPLACSHSVWPLVCL